ncbi:traf2 and NCK-interacting protein kinase-like [Scleropages formosus]|uniref:Traf2 and NCK-interacting protein kinase-like n=1 Tax=Scleropages formosus TaxID=113540 RepID=A0A0P7UD07_SCLFO|nr:traf2 and NCK-interacting protein kinase-like [Scleropages formosus]
MGSADVFCRSMGRFQLSVPWPEAHFRRPRGHARRDTVFNTLRKAYRALAEEEQVTLITESMSVTSADEEKLLLLNRNTELRRINKELMRLNEEWDHIYRNTTTGLQQRVNSLEQEGATLKHLNSRLLLKMEHEQNKKEYYEQTLLQELKKNQHLQEYVRLLENRLHHTDTHRDWTGVALAPRQGYQDSGHSSPLLPGSPPATSRWSRTQATKSSPWREPSVESDTEKEMRNLKEQLEALRCQENKKLRLKESEMRQQMALLQEQLKVYEDDFRRERSDKQLLQRLLLKKTPSSEPVLVHRCNNEQEVPTVEGGDRERQRERERRGRCSKQCERHGHKAERPRNTCPQRHMEVQTSPFSEEYN